MGRLSRIPRSRWTPRTAVTRLLPEHEHLIGLDHEVFRAGEIEAPDRASLTSVTICVGMSQFVTSGIAPDWREILHASHDGEGRPDAGNQGHDRCGQYPQGHLQVEWPKLQDVWVSILRGLPTTLPLR